MPVFSESVYISVFVSSHRKAVFNILAVINTLVHETDKSQSSVNMKYQKRLQAFKTKTKVVKMFHIQVAHTKQKHKQSICQGVTSCKYDQGMVATTLRCHFLFPSSLTHSAPLVVS